jgi:putative YhbY family RNA-binding protein
MTVSESPREGSAPTLSPRERSALRARAHRLEPVVMVGDAGLTPAVLQEARRSLEAHELIKIRVTGDDRQARDDIMRRICAELQAAPVQQIGKILVVYRQRADKPAKPKARPRRKPERPLKRSFQNRA